MSITKLNLARIQYIREHYYPFISHQIGKRTDIVNANVMGKDTAIIETGLELLFRAICKMENLSPEETDKIAISEYANVKTYDDEYLDKLSDFAEFEYNVKKKEAITPMDRKLAVEQRRKEKYGESQEISDEWGKEE